MDIIQKLIIISMSISAGVFFGLWNNSSDAGIFMFCLLITFAIIMDYTHGGD